MARYGYKAYDRNGKLVQGELLSDSREAVLETLHRRGDIPFEIIPDAAVSSPAWWQREVFAGRRPSLHRLALFTRELATLIRAELPLDEALRIVALQPLLHASMRRMAVAMLKSVQEGRSLSQALMAEKGVPEYVWRLVLAGETSGALPDVMEELAQFLEKSAEARSKVRAALIYPAILMLAAVVAIGVILGVLLPTVVPILRDAGSPLPPMLSFLEALRGFLEAYWVALVLCLLLLVLGLAAATRNTAAGHLRSWLALRMPVLGRLVTERESARFARTMATLIKGGAPMLDAIRISGDALSNLQYRSAVQTVGNAVKEGATLAQPLAASALFPEIAVRLIAVGEQAGRLDVMLTRAADILETAFQRRMDRFVTLLTPALTIVIGVLVGGLMVSVMSALIGINEYAFK